MQTLTDVFSDKANKAFHSIFADFLPTSADGVITFTVRGYGGKTACMTVPLEPRFSSLALKSSPTSIAPPWRVNSTSLITVVSAP